MNPPTVTQDELNLALFGDAQLLDTSGKLVFKCVLSAEWEGGRLGGRRNRFNVTGIYNAKRKTVCVFVK